MANGNLQMWLRFQILNYMELACLIESHVPFKKDLKHGRDLMVIARGGHVESTTRNVGIEEQRLDPADRKRGQQLRLHGTEFGLQPEWASDTECSPANTLVLALWDPEQRTQLILPGFWAYGNWDNQFLLFSIAEFVVQADLTDTAGSVPER